MPPSTRAGLRGSGGLITRSCGSLEHHPLMGRPAGLNCYAWCSPAGQQARGAMAAAEWIVAASRSPAYAHLNKFADIDGRACSHNKADSVIGVGMQPHTEVGERLCSSATARCSRTDHGERASGRSVDYCSPPPHGAKSTMSPHDNNRKFTDHERLRDIKGTTSAYCFQPVPSWQRGS